MADMDLLTERNLSGCSAPPFFGQLMPLIYRTPSLSLAAFDNSGLDEGAPGDDRDGAWIPDRHNDHSDA